MAEGLAGDGVFLWQVPNTPSHDCFIRATATDRLVPSLNASFETKAAFTISPPYVDTEAPNVQIVSPAMGAALDNIVPVVINATDNLNAVRVELFLDRNSIGNLTTTPLSLKWDTRLGPNGPHTIMARAWDGAGNTGDSTLVSVTVKNAVPKQTGGEEGIPVEWWAVAVVLDMATVVIIIAALVWRRKKAGPPII